MANLEGSGVVTVKDISVRIFQITGQDSKCNKVVAGPEKTLSSEVGFTSSLGGERRHKRWKQRYHLLKQQNR